MEMRVICPWMEITTQRNGQGKNVNSHICDFSCRVKGTSIMYKVEINVVLYMTT